MRGSVDDRFLLRGGDPYRLLIGAEEIVVGNGSRLLYPRLRVRRGEPATINLIGRRPQRYSAIWIRGANARPKLTLARHDATRIAPTLELFGWPFDVIWG